MRRRVLLTGGTGFVGANLVRRLLADGHAVHCLVRSGSANAWRLADVRAEDVMRDSVKTLTPVLEKVGVGASPDTLSKPTWNGNALGTVYPWGTIRTPTPEANKAEAERLSPAVRDEIRQRTWQYLETFDYKGFI